MNKFSNLSIMLAVILIGCAIFSTINIYKTSPGIDFYQFWGVCKANESSSNMLSSPYINLEQYGKSLDYIARNSGDARLESANQKNHFINNHGLDVNCTPILYALFAVLPQDYSFSFAIFLVIRVILFVATFYLLASTSRVRWFTLTIGILSLYFYEPLTKDSVVGNLNVFQLFVFSAILHFIGYNKLNDSIEDKKRSVSIVSVILSVLLLSTLLKPNILLVALAITASLAALCGVMVFLRAVAAALLVGIVSIIIPCIHFNSWSIWLNWSDYLSLGSNKLNYSIWSGNFSTPLVVSTIFKTTTISINIALMGVLLSTALLVIMITGSTKAKIYQILRDPYLCASLAVSCTLALSPLSWYHYYCIILLPALWMLTIQPGILFCRVMGVLSLLLNFRSWIKQCNILILLVV